MDTTLKKCVRLLYMSVIGVISTIIFLYFIINTIIIIQQIDVIKVSDVEVKNIIIIIQQIDVGLVIKNITGLVNYYVNLLSMITLDLIFRLTFSLLIFILSSVIFFIPVALFYIKLVNRIGISDGDAFGISAYCYIIYCLGLVCTEYVINGTVNSTKELQIFCAVITIYIVVVTGIWAFKPVTNI